MSAFSLRFASVGAAVLAIVLLQPSFELAPTAQVPAPLRFDLFWQHNSGALSAWEMADVTRLGEVALAPAQLTDANWKMVGAGDFNGDGQNDLIWHHQTNGGLAVWVMHGSSMSSADPLSPGSVADTHWKVRAVGDLNNNGQPDLIWQHDVNGSLSVWFMNGTSLLSGEALNPPQVADLNWHIVGTGDTNGDGKTDLIWHHRTQGHLSSWHMNGVQLIPGGGVSLTPATVPDTNWQVRAVGRMNHADALVDLIWQHQTSNALAVWHMNGETQIDGVALSPSSNASGWQVATTFPSWQVGTPVLSVAAGTYGSDVNVTGTTHTSGATLRYSLDGSEPTVASPVMPAPLAVTQSATLKVKAFKTSYEGSRTTAAAYTLQVATPAISHATGTYNADLSVTLTCATSSAPIRYTLNGTEPTAASTLYTTPLAITASSTLRVKAFRTGWTQSSEAATSYTLQPLAPSMNPAAGTYATAQTVTLSTATGGAVIRYTTDGTDPIDTSALYSSPVQVPTTRPLKAAAFKAGWLRSSATVAAYTIQGTLDPPAIAPVGGSYGAPQLITITAASGATIRYTTDGTDPTATSALYAYPFLVDRTTTVRASAFRSGFHPGAVATATYSFEVAGQTQRPNISPAGGRFAAKQTVTITGAAGAVIRYSTTGVDPVDTDAIVPIGGVITVDRAQIVKARAWLSGSSPSSVRRTDFVITGALAAGHQHSLAVASDGTLHAWGTGSSGRLGDNGNADRATPVFVASNIIAAAGGESHSLAIRDDNTIRAFGSNVYGQLGDGTTSNRLTPVATLGVADVIAVAAGYDHSLALKRDGTVWAWGNNADGQLGDGTNTLRTSPVQVPGLTGITSIAAGQAFSLALRSDGAAGGSIWAWGTNAVGQLGDGTVVSSRNVPAQVNGLTTAIELDAGQTFAVARLADGTVRAWGENDVAQLGRFAPALSNVPLVVPSLVNITAVTAGARHALALDVDGRVWGWGLNTDGQLGTSNYTSAIGAGAPQLVPGIAGALAIAAGWRHSIVLRADGTVWGTGSLLAAGLGSGIHTALAQIPNLSLAPNAWLLTDADQDGLPAWREYLAGVDPLSADTNGNGLSDLVDVRRLTESANPDDDGDGVPNVLEIPNGTDPFSADTDGDGVPDRQDDYPLDPTRTQKPAPNPSDTTPPVINLIYPASARPVGGG